LKQGDPRPKVDWRDIIHGVDAAESLKLKVCG
jgi:hypothetical protein